MVKTLKEQIKEIHSRYFNPEFHEYRKDITPAMVNDLKMKFFDLMELDSEVVLYWFILDSQDVRAVKEASKYLETYALRDTIPAVE